MQLTSDQVRLLRTTLDSVLPEAEAWIFGSRATGRARPFSDIDLLITQPAQMSWSERAALRDALDESDLPFTVDVVSAATLAPGFAERVLRERLPLPPASALLPASTPRTP